MACIHSFPWLYKYRPLWDIVVISFMFGGSALCFTANPGRARVAAPGRMGGDFGGQFPGRPRLRIMQYAKAPYANAPKNGLNRRTISRLKRAPFSKPSLDLHAPDCSSREDANRPPVLQGRARDQSITHLYGK